MTAVKDKKSGFTLVELLTVLAIIAMLAGLLVPSLTAVRRIAKETKQKAHLAAIDIALTAFRNDDGDYPPSDGWDSNADQWLDYCGAQKLAEALLGWDLMGFYSKSTWDAAGTAYGTPDGLNLDNRKGRYLELATANAFRLGVRGPGMRDGLYNLTGTALGLAPKPYPFVLCDVFARGENMITLPDGKTVKAGTPILYYKADTSGKIIGDIYHVRDNWWIVKVHNVPPDNDWLVDTDLFSFYGDPDPPIKKGFIWDSKVPGHWPYRPDSYLLITAGADGIYGTGDDICNFGD